MKKQLISSREYSQKIESILCTEPDPSFARRAKIIFENLDLKGRKEVLEVGCGRGFYLKTLKTVWPDLVITGVDVNQNYLDVARGYLGDLGVGLIRGDATDLPFTDNSFDRIIATEVLEHIPDDQKVVSEMYRVLKPGGIAMVTVPNKNYPFCWDPLNWILERVFSWHIPSNIWWLAGLWADHVRLYEDKDLKDKLKKVGFKIEKVWYSTHYCFPFSHFFLYGIGKNLVEQGFLKSFNRFKGKQKQSLINKFLLYPIRKIDSLNKDGSGNISCVNLVVKIIKE